MEAMGAKLLAVIADLDFPFVGTLRHNRRSVLL